MIAFCLSVGNIFVFLINLNPFVCIYIWVCIACTPRSMQFFYSFFIVCFCKISLELHRMGIKHVQINLNAFTLIMVLDYLEMKTGIYLINFKCTLWYTETLLCFFNVSCMFCLCVAAFVCLYYVFILAQCVRCDKIMFFYLDTYIKCKIVCV